jgi:hypothetical protein
VQPSLLNPAAQQEWLTQHIPHRLRAILARIPMPFPWDVPIAPIGQRDEISRHCIWAAIHEGRLTSIRWLIMFVGIQEKAGRAVEWRLSHKNDMRIDNLAGGIILTAARPDALKLALVWKGCSQATSHATEDANHPDLSDATLAEAMGIIIAHLEQTIYAKGGINLLRVTLGR